MTQCLVTQCTEVLGFFCDMVKKIFHALHVQCNLSLFEQFLCSSVCRMCPSADSSVTLEAPAANRDSHLRPLAGEFCASASSASKEN